MVIEVLEFIKTCIRRHRIHWTYHVNMRLEGRFIPREAILSSVDSYEIIEEYLENKYLPSYLVYAEYKGEIIHIHIATDLKNDRVTIVTAYKPTSNKWKEGFKKRRK
ncbi:DUF4258 domain-containing protein [candidate division WOR-3 bacterium]|nr:DUF4258 domain-containing protein [candidate division WOR-3 bacterium]MCK4528448.1 DUF4258 domain-containing protein [candidate division WOR-3 bacterium]